MKIEIDKKFFKMAMYAVLTVIVSYILISIFDIFIASLANIKTLVGDILGAIKYLLKVFNFLIIAFIFSYLLDPLVDKYQRLYEKYELKFMNDERATKKTIKEIKLEEKQKNEGIDGKNGFTYKPRTAGTVLVFLTIFVSLFIFTNFMISSFSPEQGDKVIETLIENDSINSEEAEQLMLESNFLRKITLTTYGMIESLNSEYARIKVELEKLGLLDIFNNTIEGIVAFVRSFSFRFIGILIKVGSGILSSIIILTLSFYIMRDKDKFKHNLEVFMTTFFPSKVNTGIKHFMDDVHTIFSGYLRGQMTDAMIMGSLLGFSLSLAGIPFAWLIGMFSGFSNLIPYVGAFVGFLLAVTSGLLSGNPILALYAAVIVLIVQQIDGLFIVPKFVGESVEISPFLVILSLTVAGTVFGIVGMIFAVPITAMLKILIGRYMLRKKEGGGFRKFFSRIKNIEI